MPSPEQLAAQLRQLSQAISPRSIAKRIGTRAVQQAQDALETEGASIGETWAARQEPGNTRRLLLGRGNLYRALQYRISGAEIQIGADGNVIPYAQIHNEGGQVPVTQQMRKFFWAKYYEQSGGGKRTTPTADFYKRLALTKKSAFTMPTREFLRPDMPKLIAQVNHDIEGDVNKILRP